MTAGIDTLDLRALAGQRWSRYQNTLKSRDCWRNDTSKLSAPAYWMHTALNAFLDLRKPAYATDKAWGMLANDAQYIIETCGGVLDAFGWSALDIFGCDPIDPLEINQNAGLCIRLRGRQLGLIGQDALFIIDIGNDLRSDIAEFVHRRTELNPDFYLWDLNGRKRLAAPVPMPRAATLPVLNSTKYPIF